jgi:hypothetical protein
MSFEMLLENEMREKELEQRIADIMNGRDFKTPEDSSDDCTQFNRLTSEILDYYGTDVRGFLDYAMLVKEYLNLMDPNMSLMDAIEVIKVAQLIKPVEC